MQAGAHHPAPPSAHGRIDATWLRQLCLEAGADDDYRKRVRESETVSTWQSLAFGPNYKAAYCMAVPAAAARFREVLPELIPAANCETSRLG